MLLYGHAKNAYWYGSQLSIEETGELAPYQNATGLQVTSAVLAGIVWMLENPDRGIVEADEIDFRRCLEIQRPYLGPVIGQYTDWTPLDGRGGLFPEDIDATDPWQFKNVLVADHDVLSAGGHCRAVTRQSIFFARCESEMAPRLATLVNRVAPACAAKLERVQNSLGLAEQLAIGFGAPNFARACGRVPTGGVRTRGRTAAYRRAGSESIAALPC